MGIQVNIGEAKDRLSQLVAAAERGEDVVIARAGRQAVRLTPIDVDGGRLEFAAKRRAFIGSARGEADDIDWFAPLSEAELALWYDGAIFPEKRDGPAA